MTQLSQLIDESNVMKFTGNPYQKYWWHEEQVATLIQMAKEGASLGEIQLVVT